MGNPEQPKPEGINEENLIGDVNEAAEGAYAEKPARDFATEHATELSVEQKQTLDWFASSEGEKTLGDFRKLKEEQRDLVRQKAYSLFKLGPDLTNSIQIANRDIEREISGGERDIEQRKQELGAAPERINELVKTVLAQEIDDTLNDPTLTYSSKINSLTYRRRFIRQGICAGIRPGYDWEPKVTREYTDTSYKVGWRRNTLQNMQMQEAQGMSKEELRDYLYGSMIGAVAAQEWGTFTELVRQADGVEQGAVILNRFADFLGNGQKNSNLDALMTQYNYLFNPKSNKYEKAT